MATPAHQLPSEYDSALERLDAALAEAGLEVEICVVGGAVFPVPFVADRTLRRPDEFFASLADFRRIAQQAGREGPGLGWIRNLVPRGLSAREPWIMRKRLRLYEAPAEYVFAMRCLALPVETSDGAREAVSDLRFLLRALGARSGSDAMQLLEPYAIPSQLPPDIGELLDRLTE